jgi:hypothetical protein
MDNHKSEMAINDLNINNQVINQYKTHNKAYYEVKSSVRLVFALVYFGLILFLGLGITYS